VSAPLPRTLFLARGNRAVAWYRCALPALALGCDWVGVLGEPEAPRLLAGSVGPEFTLAAVPGYEIVVVQQLKGPRWLAAIRSWQAQGVTVLYEIDDWLHGVRKLRGHALAAHFDSATVRDYELCMRAADGVICSTAWLAERYRAVNPRTWVCRNGIDFARYALTRPARAHVGIGWAGGTGHAEAVEPWVRAVGDVMRVHEATRFVSVGQPFADWLKHEFGPERCLSVPFTALEVYPAAMAHFDVALAPAGRGGYFRGKSDLRWLEASALGVPTIADPETYPDIAHGATGFHASAPDEVAATLDALVRDAALRSRVGRAAWADVWQHRRIEVAAGAWASVLHEAAVLERAA
jgi:glycosyltransferase involved in cell wall biosynthesis